MLDIDLCTLVDLRAGMWHKGVVSSGPLTGISEASDSASRLRRLAVEAVAIGYETVVNGLLTRLDSDADIDQVDVAVVERVGHTGAPTTRLDDEVKRALSSFCRQNVLQQHVFVGEERNDSFDPRQRGLVLVRSDPLDGTTNSLSLLDNWSTVVLFDMARSSRPGSFRHFAGAIATAAGWIVSWDLGGSKHNANGAYERLHGNVFLQSIPGHLSGSDLGTRRLELETLRPGESQHIAAVAASAERRDILTGRLGPLLSLERQVTFWNAAGNSIAPGLLAGNVGTLVEPKQVTLHDSALLIPFSLLGGSVFDLDTGRLMNYLDEYEAGITGQQEKPIRPFVATKHEGVGLEICQLWQDSGREGHQ